MKTIVCGLIVLYLTLVTSGLNVTAGDDVVPLKYYMDHDHCRAVISANAATVVSYASNKIKVWDVESGRELASYELPREVDEVVFHPDCVRFFVLHDREVSEFSLQRLASGPTRKFAGAMCMALSSNGAQLAVVDPTAANRLVVLDTDSLDQRLSIEANTRIKCCAWAPNGTLLAVGGESPVIDLWDTASKSLVGQLDDHDDAVSFLRFSPDGQRVVSASKDKTVKLWDAVRFRRLFTLVSQQSVPKSLAFNPSGSIVLVSSYNLDLFDTSTGQALTSIKCPQSPSSFSFAGNLMVTGSDTGVRFWDARNMREQGEIASPYEASSRCVTFSADGRQIVSHGSALSIWQFPNAFASPKINLNNGTRLNGFGGNLVTSNREGLVFAWNDTIWGIELVSGQVVDRLTRNASYYRGIAASKEVPFIVYLDVNHTDLVIWNFETGRHQKLPIARSENSPEQFTLDDTGSLLGVVDGDLSTNVYKLSPQFSKLLTISGDEIGGSLLGLSFIPNTNLVVLFDDARSRSRDSQGRLLVWDYVRKEEVRKIFVNLPGFRRMQYSEKHKALLVGTSEGVLSIVNLDEGKRRDLRVTARSIFDISISPDGKHLAVAGDGSVTIWDLDAICSAGHRTE